MTYEEAEEKCYYDDKCIAITDKHCNKTGIFGICKKLRQQNGSSGCIYRKTKGNLRTLVSLEIRHWYKFQFDISVINARKWFLEYGTSFRSIKTTAPINTEEGKYIGLILFISGFVLLVLGIVLIIVLSKTYK